MNISQILFYALSAMALGSAIDGGDQSEPRT